MLCKYFPVICCTFLLLFSFSCNTEKRQKKALAALPRTWQSTPIVIDGDSKDWPSPYPNYDAKAMVAYATSNDKRNLYITMQTGDEMTQLKILKQGMIVSIDTTGKKDAEFNINYPLQNDLDPVNLGSHEAHKNESRYSPEGRWATQISNSAKDATQFALDGFGKCNGGYMVTQATSCGIKVILRMDEYKELVWEAVVPFKAIYNKDTISAADAGRPVSVCFAVNRFKHPESKASSDNSSGDGMNNNMNSGMGAGGIRNNSGAGRGGGHNVSEDPMQHLYESTKTWKHFCLAYQR